MSLISQIKSEIENLADLGIIPNIPFALVEPYEETIQSKFQDLLNKYGFSNIKVDVVGFDRRTGDLLLKFTDKDGNQVEVFFTYLEADNAVISAVVYPHDAESEILLNNLNPPLKQYTLQYGIDFSQPFTWITKSLIHAWLRAGELIEKYQVIRGSRREKLPLVKKGLSASLVHNLKRFQLQLNVKIGG